MQQIAQSIERHYGLQVEHIEPAPRGWTAATYFVTAVGRGRFFVKVYRGDRLPPNAVAALPVLAELHRRGMSRINYPITSTAGALHELLGNRVVAVFNFIDATQTDHFDAGQLGDLIARLHDATPQIETPIVAEPFRPHYADALWRTLARAREEPGDDELRQGLRRFVTELGDELDHDWDAFGKAADRCRETNFDLVVTHGDSPWNVLQDASGAVHLVDWDGLLLAPADRDTWFFTDRPEFLHAYRARRGAFAPDDLASTFYLYDRYFEELLGFSEAILGEGTREHRAAALALLDGPWIAGLRSQIRALRH